MDATNGTQEESYYFATAFKIKNNNYTSTSVPILVAFQMQNELSIFFNHLTGRSD